MGGTVGSCRRAIGARWRRPLPRSQAIPAEPPMRGAPPFRPPGRWTTWRPTMSRSINTDVRVGVFHPGTQHSHETALAFQEAGSLAWYATSIFYDAGRWPYNAAKFLPPAARVRFEYEFKRRYHQELDPSLVRTFGVWEWVERLSMRAGFRTLEHYANEWGNVRFGRRVADLAARTSVDAIWGSDTSSLTAFSGVKDRGVRCILDQTVGHPRVWNRILTEERCLVGRDFDPYPPPYPEAET